MPHRLSRTLGALTAILLGLAALALPVAGPVQAALTVMGPVDPSTGFPSYYEDATGLRLQPCIMSTTSCFTGATVPNISQPASVSTGNLPTESFYYAANANVATAGGGNAFFQASLSGGFVGHVDCGTVTSCPEPGKQAVFGRLRVRIDNLVPGQLYTITHPWGKTRLRAATTGLRSIDYTVDTGCAASPGAPVGCNPALALGGPAAPFLGWDPAVAPAAPAGFLGSWPVRHAITGSRVLDAAGQPQNYFKVTGPNVGGAGVDSVSTSLFQVNGQVDRPAIPDTFAPSAPGNLVATATGTGTVRLTWDASTDGYGVPRYEVLRDGDLTPLATVAGTSYLDSGLAVAATHTYQVVALDGAGNRASASTGVTTAFSQDVSAPTAPGSPSLTAVAPTRLDLAWAPGTDDFGVTSYRVYRDGLATPLAVVATGTRYSDTDIAPGSSHRYRVTALDDAGNESSSSAESAGSTAGVPDATAPEGPTGVAAAATGTSSVIVTWNAAVDNVGPTAYRVFRDGTQVAATAGTVLIFTDTGLAAGSTHTYTVSALDAAGNVSNRVSAATVTTAPAVSSSDRTPPSVPDAVTTVAGSPTRVTLSWLPSTDDTAVTGYHVYRDGTLAARVTTPRYVDNGLVSGDTYRYAVAAFDAAGNESARSLVVPATTILSTDITPPTAPPALTATATDSTTVALTWGASTDNVGLGSYRLYRNGDPTPVATLTGLVFTDRLLTPGATYTYVATATDRVGNESDASAAASATPLRTRCKPPVIGTAGAGTTSDTVVSATATWRSPARAGCIVTGYSVTAVRVAGGARKTVTAGPTATSLTVTGLVSGQQYTFVVKATDGLSTSVASATSNAVLAR